MYDDSFKQPAKADVEFLKSVLRVSVAGTSAMHAECPICGDKTCLQFGPSKEKQGEYFWYCHKGCGGGDIVEALVKIENKSHGEALKFLKQKYGSGSEKKGQCNAYQRNGTQSGPLALPAPIEIEKTRREPRLDIAQAEDFVKKYHDHLLNHLDLVTHFRRGLSEEVIRKYRIGFIENENLKFAPWHRSGSRIPAAWVLPITDEVGRLKGVRMHFEIIPKDQHGKPIFGKVMSAPFGTEPAWDQEKNIRPHHAYFGLWPHPDTLTAKDNNQFSLNPEWYIKNRPPHMDAIWDQAFEAAKLQVAFENSVSTDRLENSQLDEAMNRAFSEIKPKLIPAVCKIESRAESNQTDWTKYIFICPGELKALALESCGLMATSPTGGESWTPSGYWMNRFTGQLVCLMFDDDPPKRNEKTGKIICTGLAWASKWAQALMEHGAAHVIAKSAGRLKREERSSPVDPDTF